jgi:hypothetical protein
MKWTLYIFAALYLLANIHGIAKAQEISVGFHPTVLSALVPEQASLFAPSILTFSADDFRSGVAQKEVAVHVSGIVLESATKRLRISLIALSETFTSSLPQAPHLQASDVRWDAPPWINATGKAGQLSARQFQEIATSDPDILACSTDHLAFTLTRPAEEPHPGSYTLGLTWKVESFEG